MFIIYKLKILIDITYDQYFRRLIHFQEITPSWLFSKSMSLTLKVKTIKIEYFYAIAIILNHQKKYKDGSL